MVEVVGRAVGSEGEVCIRLAPATWVGLAYPQIIRFGTAPGKIELNQESR